MSITIGICTLVLGGVMLPESELPLGGSVDITGAQPLVELAPQDARPAVPDWDSGGFGDGLTYPSRTSNAADLGRATGAGSLPGYPDAPFTEPAGAYGLSTSRGMAMPFAPTDPSAASGAFPWAPPTADSSAEVQQPQQGAGVGDSPTAYAVPGLSGGAAYFTPRASRPTFQPPTSYDSFTTQQARLSIGARANRAAGGSPLLDTPKPFSDYDQPAAVSPYMELGRISSYAGDIDNYSQFVKPQLERQRASQQVGSQIRQLQTNVRALNTETQSLRGVRIPQYFMDYGGYYPALSR